MIVKRYRMEYLQIFGSGEMGWLTLGEVPSGIVVLKKEEIE